MPVLRLLPVALAAAALTVPAAAQNAEAPLPDPLTVADNWTVAVGGAWLPDYVGSDDYRLIPAGAVRGKIGPVAITTRATYLYADLFERPDEGIDLDLGPIAGVRLNRTGKIEDDVVALLPDRDMAIEVGAFAGVSLHDLTNPYDTLAFRVDLLRDVGGAHGSTVISPSVEFATPLSRRTYASASLGAEFVSDSFAEHYFGIGPAESIASGLPVHDPDGGMKSWKAGLLLNQSVTGDLTGGISVFGTASWSRLAGDFAESPIVSQRGSRNQWLLASGLAYTW